MSLIITYRRFSSPPPPPPFHAVVGGLVEKYNGLLRDLVYPPKYNNNDIDNHDIENDDDSLAIYENQSGHFHEHPDIAANIPGVKHHTDREWLNARASPEVSEEVDENPVMSFAIPGHIPTPGNAPGHIPTPGNTPGHIPTPGNTPGHIPTADLSLLTGHSRDSHSFPEVEDEEEEVEEEGMGVEATRALYEDDDVDNDEDEELADEWEDDNDLGYLTIVISEREFIEMEEVRVEIIMTWSTMHSPYLIIEMFT